MMCHVYDVSPEGLQSMLAPPSAAISARQVASGKTTEADRETRAARITLAERPKAWPPWIWSSKPPPRMKRSSARSSADLPVLNPEAMLATNTSSLSITRLASATDRPERFIGIHFMNPVPVMKLVELVRGIATEDVTFRPKRDFVDSLDKTITVAEDFPAFIVNRILLPMINEAIYTLYEGVGSVEAIDTAMKLAPITRWVRWNWPISSASTPACRSCRCCMTVCRIRNTGPVRFW
jgi:3-hydroxybutyryl-CoA dehydrogenase